MRRTRAAARAGLGAATSEVSPGAKRSGLGRGQPATTVARERVGRLGAAPHRQQSEDLGARSGGGQRRAGFQLARERGGLVVALGAQQALAERDQRGPVAGLALEHRAEAGLGRLGAAGLVDARCRA